MINLRKKKPEIKLSSKYYYFGLIGIPAIGIVIKNILFQAFLLGPSMYNLSVIEAIGQTWKYWILYLGVTLLLLSFTLLISNDLVKGIFVIIVDFTITLLIYCDLIYNRSFFTMPSVVNIAMVTNFSGMDSSELTSLMSWYDLVFLTDLIFLIFYLIMVKKKKHKVNAVEEGIFKREEKLRLRKVFWGMNLTCIVVLGLIPVEAKALKINEEAFEELYMTDDANQQAKYFTALGFHVKDIYEIIDNALSDDILEEEKKMIEEFYKWNGAGEKNDKMDSKYEGIYKGKNIIFIQVESMESFVIGQRINGREITPILNRLADNGIYFKNIYEGVRGGNSSDADLMYMTSMLPVSKGCTFYRYSDVRLNSLPRMLENEGYKTAYYQSIDGRFWNYEKALTNMIGIDEFHGIEEYSQDEIIGFSLADGSFLDQTFDKIKDEDGKYYKHIVCNTSHMPFEIDDKNCDIELPKKLKNTYAGNYLKCMNYVDKCIGEFIGKLEKSGMLENAVVVVAGDHNGLHKYYAHTLEELYDDFDFLDVNEEECVPFIVYGGKEGMKYYSEKMGNQIDVMPTIAYLLGYSDSEYMSLSMGKNLFGEKREFALLRENKVLGDVTPQDKKIIKTMYSVSDDMFRMLSKRVNSN